MTSVAAKLISPNVNYLKNVDWYRTQLLLKLNQDGGNKIANNFQVLFKSKDYLVVNKPFNLATYTYDKTSPQMPSLFELIKEKFPFYYDPTLKGGYHVLHRLDTHTSGCICIPLNKRAQVSGIGAFMNGSVRKEYLALVHGHLQERGTFKIEVPIGQDLDRIRHSMCTPLDRFGNLNKNCFEPEAAATQVKVLEYGTYAGKECSKLSVELLTGKRHQLRVHLSYLGYPVVGDLIYGNEDNEDFNTTLRMMLHAHKFRMKVLKKSSKSNKKISKMHMEIIEATAPDPFINEIDSNWISLEKL